MTKRIEALLQLLSRQELTDIARKITEAKEKGGSEYFGTFFNDKDTLSHLSKPLNCCFKSVSDFFDTHDISPQDKGVEYFLIPISDMVKCIHSVRKTKIS